jgi:phosphatidylglycerophosphatase A
MTRPDQSQKYVAVTLATTFGLGYLPKAPGTWGSLPGIPIAMICNEWSETFFPSQPWTFLGLLMLAFIALALWSISETERLWKTHDDRRIVIDETVGQTLALMWFAPDIILAILGFVIFRLLDIAKPGPIGWIDRQGPGAFGTLFDDVLAGLVTAGILYGFTLL